MQRSPHMSLKTKSILSAFIKMRVIITGAGGLIGRHLVEFLSSRGHELHLIAKSQNEFLKKTRGKCLLYVGDVRNKQFVEQTITKVGPDIVYHLAAQSSPSRSWQEPQKTFDVNVNGTLSVLEALRKTKSNQLLISVCSSAEYKEKEGALKEDDDLDPVSPYGISKLSQDHFTQIYARLYGLKTIRCRPFFLIGPGKEGDVCTQFAKQIVAIERGAQKVLKVGNLSPVRDLLDVRDGVRAMDVVAERGERGSVYNICSGVGVSIEKVLFLLRSFSDTVFKVEVDPSLLRPVDQPSVIGNPEKLVQLGWKRQCSLESTLKNILGYWRLHL